MATRKSKKIGHGGDVQFMEVDSLPKTAKKISNKPVAYGEHSGHIHVVTGDVEMFEDTADKKLYAKVGKKGAMLQHLHETTFGENFASMQEMPKADHNAITLDPNTTYVFGIHKRYNPFSKVWEDSLD